MGSTITTKPTISHKNSFFFCNIDNTNPMNGISVAFSSYAKKTPLTVKVHINTQKEEHFLIYLSIYVVHNFSIKMSQEKIQVYKR